MKRNAEGVVPSSSFVSDFTSIFPCSCSFVFITVSESLLFVFGVSKNKIKNGDGDLFAHFLLLFFVLKWHRKKSVAPQKKILSKRTLTKINNKINQKKKQKKK
jgi:hypothetical protein